MKNVRSLLIAIALSVGLGGCSSGEPNESSMKSAVEASISKRISEGRAMMGNIPQARTMFPDFTGFASFKKLSCVAANDEPGFICDFQAMAHGQTTLTAKGRFFKGGDVYLFEERG